MIIGEVENSKQVHLSEAERMSLAVDLFKLNEPISQTQKRAEYVKKNLTYGKLSLDVWLSSEPVFIGEEIARELNRREAQRRREYLGLNQRLESEEEELTRQGLMEISFIYIRRRDELLVRIKDSLDKRCRKAKAFIHACDDSTKNEILELALSKGLIVYDQFWRQSLPFLAPLMLDDIENIMKRR